MTRQTHTPFSLRIGPDLAAGVPESTSVADNEIPGSE